MRKPAEREAVLEYNRELLAFLTELWSAVPQGRRKQLIKQPRIRALLARFGMPLGEESL